MFGLSHWEIGLILFVVLIAFGPAKIPALARDLGKGLREFRGAVKTGAEEPPAEKASIESGSSERA